MDLDPSSKNFGITSLSFRGQGVLAFCGALYAAKDKRRLSHTELTTCV